ncbi:MAG TPA: GNAT family N-acetyltransferase [Actinomycetota bacterium]|jgi:predicted GNAT superfamily acetyltransferase
MTRGVVVRELSSIEEAREAAGLIDGIWGGTRIITPELMRALATHGGLVLGAFLDDRLAGAQVAFLGMVEGEVILHSHVTGVPPEHQHGGVGLALKGAQRAWCLARDIAAVTWTFDPLIARNAYFNLHKLGAVAVRFLPDFYGPMDDPFNAGHPTDRLEIRWEVGSERVEQAMSGRAQPVPQDAAPPLLDDEGGLPAPRPEATGQRLLVRVPSDYLLLRETDPAAAAAWREAVRRSLIEAFRRRYRAIGFARSGAYLLERT